MRFGEREGMGRLDMVLEDLKRGEGEVLLVGYLIYLYTGEGDALFSGFLVYLNTGDRNVGLLITLCTPISVSQSMKMKTDLLERLERLPYGRNLL
jgi:hypothetical protein